MTQRDQVETSAVLLAQARGLLNKAHLWLLLLGDVKRASILNRIIGDIEAERRRWLRTTNNPFF